MILIYSNETKNQHGWTIKTEIFSLGVFQYRSRITTITPANSQGTVREDDFYLSRGAGAAFRWVSNDSVIMDDVIRDHHIDRLPGYNAAKQTAARQVQLDQVFASYRRNQPAQPSAEERFEMQAAFGPGAVVVDVITGRRTQL